MRLVRAAGGILWRETSAGVRIAVIHRSRRDDWSLPKGRLDPGESFQRAALREVSEETGCEVTLGSFAGGKLYVDRPEPKLVLYWHMRFIRGDLPMHAEEVDEMAWLSRREALARLDHGSDRLLLVRALEDSPRGDLRPGAPDGARELVRRLIVDAPRSPEKLSPYLTVVARALAAPTRRLRVRASARP